MKSMNDVLVLLMGVGVGYLVGELVGRIEEQKSCLGEIDRRKSGNLT